MREVSVHQRGIPYVYCKLSGERKSDQINTTARVRVQRACVSLRSHSVYSCNSGTAERTLYGLDYARVAYSTGLPKRTP